MNKFNPAPRMVPVLALAGVLSASLGFHRFGSVEQDPNDLAHSLSSAYQQLAQEVGPAVVQVKAYKKIGAKRRGLQDGSGVIIGSDRTGGTVVTNYHVVRGADLYAVVLTDGRVLDALVVGFDKDTDLAVLKIKARGLTAVALASEVEANVGELVLAMGNPLGLGHTVTAGIVSGIGRSDLNIAFYEDFIQTDAAINLGNSGGPLINLDGEVLGINTAVSITAEDKSIAFAIPSRMVRRSVEDILRYGLVKRGFLGVKNKNYWRAAQTIERARPQGFAGVSRIVVDTVEANSPASRAGLKVNDIILRIAGTRISDQRSFRTAIADVQPGEESTISVWRAGEQLSLPVTMVLRPESED